MIAKVENLESIFRIRQCTWTLLQNAVDNIIVRISQLSAREGNTQKSASIDSALTVDKHGLTLSVLEKSLHSLLELIIPVQNERIDTIYGI